MSASPKPLSEWVGVRSARYEEELTPQRIAAFRGAVGASVASDAPPTFMTTFRRGEFELFEKLGIPLSSVLHGEQLYEYRQPLRVGDKVSYESWLSEFSEKSGSRGSLRILHFDTEVRLNAALAGTSRTTIVIREKKEKA